jgi:para-nitrobenzyl esterase
MAGRTEGKNHQRKTLTMIDELIEVEGGPVRGITSRSGACRIFRGLPYAAPPIGEFRWRAPQPVISWEGVLSADRFGSACIQPLLARNAIMNTLSFGVPPESGISEDCLYLNVWSAAAAPSYALPVIVWVPGGGFRVGAGSHPGSDGEHLASQGAVVVSINYRLNALGFLAHPALTREAGTAGNYGCLDVLAALRWVQRSIAAFGGDPGRVTLVAQSAGASIITALMKAPAANGLFHRVVANSGSALAGPPMQTLAQAEESGVRLLESLGARTLEEIRNVPADVMFGPPGTWRIIVDGSLLEEDVQLAFAQGRQARVPLLAGYCANEASPYPRPELFEPAGFVEFAHRTFGECAEDFLKIYPASQESVKASSYAYGRDSGFAWQAWRLASLHQRSASVATYLHYLSRPAPLPPSMRFREPVPPGGYGAFHGSVLWYAFNTLHTKDWPWEHADRALAATLSAYIVNFATRGDPNSDGLPWWPRFEAAQPRAMHLGERIECGPIINQPGLEFFEHWYQSGARSRIA